MQIQNAKNATLQIQCNAVYYNTLFFKFLLLIIEIIKSLIKLIESCLDAEWMAGEDCHCIDGFYEDYNACKYCLNNRCKNCSDST